VCLFAIGSSPMAPLLAHDVPIRHAEGHGPPASFQRNSRDSSGLGADAPSSSRVRAPDAVLSSLKRDYAAEFTEMKTRTIWFCSSMSIISSPLAENASQAGNLTDAIELVKP
jgi:hypothetical protein